MSRITPQSDGLAPPGAPPYSLGRLLADGFRAWDELLHGGLEMAGYGDVRPAHFAVFRHLEPGGSRVTELAEAARMTKQSMGEMVDHLERCGYVERRPDPRDRRAKIVVFTETGRRGIGVATELVAKMEADLTERMGEGRLEELAGSLEELANLLAELAPSQADSTEPP